MEGQEYRIGDVADLVGLSRDALRFYEKKGVLVARKKENGYRYYSENDIYKLMYVLYQRKMNTSLEEIEGLVWEGTSKSNLKVRTRQRIAEERAKMWSHQQAVTRLKLVERDLESAENCLNVCQVKRFPSAYIMGWCQSLQEGLKEWFRLSSSAAGLDMTYFYKILTYEPEKGLIQEGTNLLLYRGIEPYLDAGIDLSAKQTTQEVDCIYSVVESAQALPDPSVYQWMAEWGRRLGMKPGRRIYSNNMISFFKKDTTTYCLELYLPLETKEG